MDDLDFRVDDLVKRTLEAGTIAELTPIMTEIAGLWPRFTASDVRGHKLFVERLDRTVPHIAKILRLSPVESSKSNDNVCIILTQIYAVGGHSKIAQDISRIVGAERVTIILTDLYGNTTYTQVAQSDLVGMGYFCRAFMALKARTALERGVELYNVLRAVRPTRIFLLNHHSDPAAVAATYMFKGITEFIHHGDHLPCLGATLDYSTHADVTHTCHLACAATGRPATYVGMTLPDPVASPGRTRPGGSLTLATCGSVAKYQHTNRNCRYRWSDWAVAALRDNDMIFLHFGPPTDELVADVGTALSSAGINKARYRFMGPVPSLQQALIDHGVDLYIASYPETGGRSNLEALAAGLEVIVLEDPQLGPLLKFGSPIRGWRAIERPENTTDAINAALAERQTRSSLWEDNGVEFERARFKHFVQMSGKEPSSALVHAAAPAPPGNRSGSWREP